MGLVDLTEQFKFLKNFILIFEGTFWRCRHPQVSLVNPIPVSSIHGAASLWPLDAGRAGEGGRSPEVNNFPSFRLESAPSRAGISTQQHWASSAAAPTTCWLHPLPTACRKTRHNSTQGAALAQPQGLPLLRLSLTICPQSR